MIMNVHLSTKKVYSSYFLLLSSLLTVMVIVHKYMETIAHVLVGILNVYTVHFMLVCFADVTCLFSLMFLMFVGVVLLQTVIVLLFVQAIIMGVLSLLAEDTGCR